MRKFLAVSIALAVAALLPAKDNKKDPTEIGNRNVSGGVNFTRSKKNWPSASSWRLKSENR